MDSRKKIMLKLLEMFPQLTREQAISLASSNDDFSILVTRVLDNNVERPYTDLANITLCNQSNYPIPIEYNYPEVFCRVFHDIHASSNDFRKKAAELFERIRIRGCNVGHKFRPAQTHYSIESDDIRAMAEDYNRRAAMLLMRHTLETGKALDLHGLYVNEALLFLDDLYLFYRFTDITLVTGRKYNSPKLRPAVEKWLHKNNFIVIDEGPSLRGSKRTHIHSNTK